MSFRGLRKVIITKIITLISSCRMHSLDLQFRFLENVKKKIWFLIYFETIKIESFDCIVYLMFRSTAKCNIRNGCCGSEQDHIPRAPEEEDSSLRRLQDRRTQKPSCGWEDRKPGRELRRLLSFSPRQWLQIRCLRLRFRHRWELPEEQNLLRRLVSLNLWLFWK